MKKQAIGWVLLVVMWFGGVSGIFHFSEQTRVLPGGMGNNVGTTDWLLWLPINQHFIWPLMTLLEKVCPPRQGLDYYATANHQRNLYTVSMTIYLLGISMIIYILLIRKKSRDGTLTIRKA